MFSKPLAVGVLALASITGAAAGAYFTSRTGPEAVAPAATAPEAAAPQAPAAAPQDTEAIVAPAATSGTTAVPALERGSSLASPPLEAARPRAAERSPAKAPQPAVK